MHRDPKGKDAERAAGAKPRWSVGLTWGREQNGGRRGRTEQSGMG